MFLFAPSPLLLKTRLAQYPGPSPITPLTVPLRLLTRTGRPAPGTRPAPPAHPLPGGQALQAHAERVVPAVACVAEQHLVLVVGVAALRADFAVGALPGVGAEH